MDWEALGYAIKKTFSGVWLVWWVIWCLLITAAYLKVGIVGPLLLVGGHFMGRIEPKTGR